MSRNIYRRASEIIIDSSIDSETWKNDSNCIACSKKFDKSGLSHSMKFFCKFCYRGVCGSCSEKRIPHKTLGPNQRACSLCYLIHKPQDEELSPKELYEEKCQELKILKEKLEEIRMIHYKHFDTGDEELRKSIEELIVLEFTLGGELEEIERNIEGLKEEVIKDTGLYEETDKILRENNEIQRQIEEIEKEKQMTEGKYDEGNAKNSDLEDHCQDATLCISLDETEKNIPISEMYPEIVQKNNNNISGLGIQEDNPQKKCCYIL